MVFDERESMVGGKDPVFEWAWWHMSRLWMAEDAAEPA